MALYAIGDLHLSLSCDKSMEVFGPAWENYTARIKEALGVLTEEDTIVLAGDTSWGMTLGKRRRTSSFSTAFPAGSF